MTSSQYRIYKIYVVIAFIAVISSVPLAFVLPVEWSFENGFIENAQVIILLVEAIWILSVRSPMKWFQRFFFLFPAQNRKIGTCIRFDGGL